MEAVVSGNIPPPNNRDQYSTIAAPLVVPAPAQVTTWTAAEVRLNVLPTVGTVNPQRRGAGPARRRRGRAAQRLGDLGRRPAGDRGQRGHRHRRVHRAAVPPSTQQVTVQFATAAGTATAGTDYIERVRHRDVPGRGTPTRTVNVSVIGDVLDEPNETFNLNLSSASSGATIVGSAGGGHHRRRRRDAVPVGGRRHRPGRRRGHHEYRVHGQHGQPLRPGGMTVSFATADNTRRSGASYYQPRSGVLTFPAGTATPQNGDGSGHRRHAGLGLIERFRPRLAGAHQRGPVQSGGTGTILDDDRRPVPGHRAAPRADVRADLRRRGPSRTATSTWCRWARTRRTRCDRRASGSLGTGSGLASSAWPPRT